MNKNIITQLVVDAFWLYTLDDADPPAKPGLHPEPLHTYIEEIAHAIKGAAAYLTKYDKKEEDPALTRALAARDAFAAEVQKIISPAKQAMKAKEKEDIEWVNNLSPEAKAYFERAGKKLDKYLEEEELAEAGVDLLFKHVESHKEGYAVGDPSYSPHFTAKECMQRAIDSMSAEAKAALAAGLESARKDIATGRPPTPWIDFTKYAYEGGYNPNESDEWESGARDQYYSKYEPPGSYGYCWKPIGYDIHCTMQPGHSGDCGEDE